MHLESPDKRPTEYGQNPKEFVKQEKFMIAASTLQIVLHGTDTGDLSLLLLVCELSGSNLRRKFKPSIYWCHPLLSINN